MLLFSCRYAGFTLCWMLHCDRKDMNQLPSTSWGHVEVVHFTMLFLVSLAHSYADVVQPVLCNCHNLSHWLKRLTLESPEVYYSRPAQYVSDSVWAPTCTWAPYSIQAPGLKNRIIVWLDDLHRTKPGSVCLVLS